MNRYIERLHQAIINDIINWLRVNNGNKQSIANIAAISGYSKGHIQRVLYKYHHITLGRFCRELRVSKMINDLKERKYSLVEISVIHDFPSQQTFAHYFKRETGCTPGDCRRNPDCLLCREKCNASQDKSQEEQAPR